MDHVRSLFVRSLSLGRKKITLTQTLRVALQSLYRIGWEYLLPNHCRIKWYPSSSLFQRPKRPGSRRSRYRQGLVVHSTSWRSPKSYSLFITAAQLGTSQFGSRKMARVLRRRSGKAQAGKLVVRIGITSWIKLCDDKDMRLHPHRY